ncbi:acyl carrier protein [Dysgonomonas sp. HGC4]|uniref:acyl carrier protein n=1 Tax=Dysgonomonas sp. HGC4 TaxID=1658009 RepID=UPI00068045C9|nr:acyl carrier protein [Dysgonomonas sp. HGC4]MBD8349078.1 acyl carrier protein [Dysgonomonas sp. HGC4]
MELNQFIALFAEQFEDTDTSVFTKDTLFQEIDEWSSLMALSVIGLADEEFGVRIKGDEISQVKTINGLFELIKSKK